MRKGRIRGNPELDREVEEWDRGPQAGVQELLRGGRREGRSQSPVRVEPEGWEAWKDF